MEKSEFIKFWPKKKKKWIHNRILLSFESEKCLRDKVKTKNKKKKKLLIEHIFDKITLRIRDQVKNIYCILIG